MIGNVCEGEQVLLPKWNVLENLKKRRSSGLSNAYMDTTSGLYVFKEQKDRINKKATFPTIKTIH